MKITKTSLLEAPPEWVWDRIQEPAAMKEMSKPLVSLEPIDPPRFPEDWVDGETYEAQVELLGLIPVARQTIEPRRLEADGTPGEALYRFKDEGSGTLFPTWDHTMTVRETSDGASAYTDEIEVGAGVFTPLVYPIVKLLVAHRHRRWRELASQETS
jgi:ligand-binding SRPBCC domain-containing protein